MFNHLYIINILLNNTYILIYVNKVNIYIPVDNYTKNIQNTFHFFSFIESQTCTHLNYLSLDT